MNVIKETTVKELEEYISKFEKLYKFKVKLTIYDGYKKSLGDQNFTFRTFLLNDELMTNDILEFDVFWDQIEIYSKTIIIQPQNRILGGVEEFTTDLTDKERLYKAIDRYLNN